MRYRNINTGAEIISNSVIVSPSWEMVEDKTEVPAPKEAPKSEPPKAEPPKEDSQKDVIPKEEPPKKVAAKKSTSAAKTKRTKK